MGEFYSRVEVSKVALRATTASAGFGGGKRKESLGSYTDPLWIEMKSALYGGITEKNCTPSYGAREMQGSPGGDFNSSREEECSASIGGDVI